jgi:archaellum component FlaG (FlaF/FlaG flagellin family)
MKMAVMYLYWRFRAWLWNVKWLTVMKIRGIEYAVRKFDETEIHRCHQQFRTKKATVVKALAILIMSIAIMSMTTYGAFVATRSISNNGSVRAVGVNVYTDTACTTAVSTISWGALDPGGVGTYTMYVKNTGTVPVTLSMTTGNWNPSSASSYITLTWNQQNYVLPAGQVIQAVLTLSVSSGASGIASFSFDTTITGTQ